MNKFSSSLVYAFGLLLLTASSLLQAGHAIKEHKDIQWAEAKGFKLTTDIYTPATGKKNYPVLIIYHGGGWLVNNKSIMDDMAKYMASNAELVVVNMNYRLLADSNNTTTANEIIEDVIGGVLWVKDHIKQYGGNPEEIAVTGDSAGGHLAAMALLAGGNLESDGFAGDTLGFNPSYLPKNKTAEQVARNNGARVQAAILSYAAFDMHEVAKGGFESANNQFWQFANAKPRGLFGNEITLEDRPDFYKAVSPINYIPDGQKHKLPPQLVIVGSKDTLTTPASAQHYVELLKQNGHPVEFKIYEGKGHAFLDSGCSQFTGGCFDELATPALDDMIVFLNKVFK